jgi:hypothetical protein
MIRDSASRPVFTVVCSPTLVGMWVDSASGSGSVLGGADPELTVSAFILALACAIAATKPDPIFSC